MTLSNEAGVKAGPSFYAGLGESTLQLLRDARAKKEADRKSSIPQPPTTAELIYGHSEEQGVAVPASNIPKVFDRVRVAMMPPNPASFPGLGPTEFVPRFSKERSEPSPYRLLVGGGVRPGVTDSRTGMNYYFDSNEKSAYNSQGEPVVDSNGKLMSIETWVEAKKKVR